MTKVVEVEHCAAQPVELVPVPRPLIKGHTKERDVWVFAKKNREALRSCNDKLKTLNDELIK